MHERQAERAGRRFEAGERGLRTGLTPAAPAAEMHASGSRAELLPFPLRQDLEHAFDADLSVVRIHRDEEGARVAQAHAARALAAGAHLYFATGAFTPFTRTGRALIAHEIAHVLQQTGRKEGTGTFVASRVHGSGAVQCAPDNPYADEHVPFLSSGTDALNALSERHGTHKDGDETLARLIELVKAESKGDLPRRAKSPIGTRLIAIAQAGEFTVNVGGVETTLKLTTPAKGFLVDCLKICGHPEHFEAAAHLLDTDTSFAIRSAFGPRTDFRNYLYEHRGDDWVAEAFKHPALSPIWPGVFLNTFKQYAFNPGRPRQTLYSFAETKQRELENIDGKTSDLVVSDRVAMAFALIEAYDKGRLQLFKELDEHYEKKGIGADMPTRRMESAAWMTQHFDMLLTRVHTVFWRDMLVRMRKISADAAAFWGEVGRLRKEFAETLKTGAAVPQMFSADDPILKRLHILLNTLHEPGGLYGLDADGRLDLPAATEYEKRQDALSDALGVRKNPKGNILLDLQMRLIELYDTGAPALRTDEARAIGFTIWWLLDLKSVFREYSVAKDVDARRGFGDMRLLHRADVARAALYLARIAGWDDTAAGARRILAGDDVQTSYLAVRSWRVQTDVKPLQMAEDFSGEKISEEYEITADNIAQFFHAATLQEMADILFEHVEAVKGAKAKLSVEPINKVIKEAGRPWRCVPVEPLVVRKRDDPTFPSVSRLIEGSPKSRAEFARLAQEQHVGSPYDYVSLRKKQEPVFVWILPPVRRLINHLRHEEPFLTHSQTTGLDGLSDDAWTREMAKSMGEGAYRLAVRQALTTYEREQLLAAEEGLREFTVLRRRHVRTEAAGLLKTFADHPYARNRGIPGDVVYAIDRFRLEVRPEIDALAQRSLLILSLGPDLDAAFDEVRHAAKIPPMFHQTLTETLKFADEELAKAAKGESPYAEELKPLLYVKDLAAATPGEDETFGEFLRHRTLLANVASRVEAARQQVQESRGLTSEEGTSLKSLNFYPEIKPGPSHAFEMGGEEWELVRVHEPFTYHPPLELSAPTEKSHNPILKDGKGRELKPDSRVLLTFFVDGLERDVAANDTYTLTRLSNRIFDVALAREMENLAEAIESGAMLVVDLVELVPGIGQKLMLVRLTAQTAVFLGELPQLADALRKNPAEYIQNLASTLTSKYLTPETFLRFVLLGSDKGRSPIDELRPLQKEPPLTRMKEQPRGKLGRLMRMLRKIGRRIADAMLWLQVRVRGPMRALQSAVATRPQLAWLLRRALDIAQWVRQLIPPPGTTADANQKQDRLLGTLQILLPGDIELPQNATAAEQEAHARGLIGRVEDQITAAGGQFKEQLEAKLEVLREAQLPREVIPLDLLSIFILDFFLSRLGAKVRIAKGLLKHTSPYQKLERAIGSAIADAARGTAADPNELWRGGVLDRVDEQVVAARNGLVAAIYSITDRLYEETGIAAFQLEQPDKKSTDDFKLERTPFPQEELELAPRIEGDVPSRGRLAELPATPGQPLAARVRLAQETRFGHDFRHVRLHSGEETRAPLTDLQADAATAGSHVFLRPGLTPERGEGARLLRHELTHVLQQAGARPLGDENATTEPVRGRRNGTLLIDDLREAAARAMARADGAIAREPVEVEEGAEGVQPSLESVAIELLKSLTEIGELAPAKGPVDAKDPSVVAGLGILGAVRKRLKERKDSDYVPCLQPVAAEIAHHVEQIDLSPFVKAVGALAQKPLKGARGRRPKTELDFPRFITLLEGLIFRKTGVAMQLKVKDQAPRALQDVKVTYLHLGWMLPGTAGKVPLWDKVMTTPGLISGDDPAALRLELHTRLAVMAPEPFIWKTGRREYRFSEEFVEAFGKLRASRRKDLTKDLPVKGAAPKEDPAVTPDFKNEYLNPTSQKGIGLRIGWHGGHANLEKQAGMDRESHHTTQYLLIQFFRNDNRIPAWTAGNDDPGIEPKRGKERRFFEAKTAGRLELHDLDKGGPGKRGSHMPAILIAADTHRRAQLHVGRETKWGPDGDPDSSDAQGRATQGYAISAEWKRQLIAHVGTHHQADDWKIRIKSPDASDKVHAAMIGTYHWMHKQMMPALERGLKTRELAYYRSVAARKPGAVDAKSKLTEKYNLESPELERVFARARRHNDEVMAKAGWKAP